MLDTSKMFVRENKKWGGRKEKASEGDETENVKSVMKMKFASNVVWENRMVS